MSQKMVINNLQLDNGIYLSKLCITDWIVEKDISGRMSVTLKCVSADPVSFEEAVAIEMMEE